MISRSVESLVSVMSAKLRVVYSFGLGIGLEGVIIWLFWKTFSFHNAKQPSGLIADIHAPVAHLLAPVVGEGSAFGCSWLVMALCWTVALYCVLTLVGKLRHNDKPMH